MDRLPGLLLGTLGVILLMGPVLNPWYVTWLVPFLCFERRPAWLVLTGTVAISYVYFWQMRDLWWIRWVEFAPVYALLLWQLWQDRRRIILDKEGLRRT